MIPTVRVHDLDHAVAFYTDVLDLDAALVVGGDAVLARGADELYLERNPDGAGPGIAAVLVADPDGNTLRFIRR